MVVGLFGMLTALLTGLNERRREMAILRSVGARPVHVFSLIIGEAVLITSLGIILGIIALHILLALTRSYMISSFGISLGLGSFTAYEFLITGIVWFAGLVAGIVPGWRIYHYSLVDGLSVKT